MEKLAVIMAGGSGTRLWPLSREKAPKQFIKTKQDKSMLMMTLERITKSVPADNCYIITGKDLYEITRDEVQGFIPESNILLEPKKRNTAACIAYAALLLEQKHKKGVLCIIPADSTIENIYDGKFMTALYHAFNAAEKSDELVVVGIKPTYPSTGYGYIRFNKEATLDSRDVFRVDKFVEKPDTDKAKAFLESKEYLWNSGMVIGSIDAILNNVMYCLPNHYERLKQALEWQAKTGSEDYISQAYDLLENVSFDTGVLEKSRNIHVVRAYFTWEDIGSLDALSESFLEDEHQNRIQGDYYGIDAKSNIIYADEGLVATINVENLMIIRSKDAVLVCPKDKAQHIKHLVEDLRLKGYEKYL